LHTLKTVTHNITIHYWNNINSLLNVTIIFKVYSG